MQRRILRYRRFGRQPSLSTGAYAQTKWTWPPPTRRSTSTENIEQFVQDVDKATQFAQNYAPLRCLAVQNARNQACRANRQRTMGEFFLVISRNEAQMFGLDGLPFLVKNYDEAFKLYQAQKPFLEKLLDKQGQVLLYAVAWPPQSIYSNKTIQSAADLKGLKWRVYSPTTARGWANFGRGAAATIQEAELSQALATGVIEGLITSSATGADNKLFRGNSSTFTKCRPGFRKRRHRQQKAFNARCCR